jgi:hypothetical protein
MVNKCDLIETTNEAQEVKKLLEAQEAVSSVAIRFPCRLLEMIKWCKSEQADKEGVSLLICWSPNGKYFTINDQEKLSKHVLRRFFKDSKFDSFQRKLYRWGFKQITSSKRDLSRQGRLSFYVDGFERDESISWTKLKVRYSVNETLVRMQKSLEAKLKKMEKKSDPGNTSERRTKEKRELEVSPNRLGTRCNRDMSGTDAMKVPCLIWKSKNRLVHGPAVRVSENASADNRQVASMADIQASRQTELPVGCVLPSKQHVFPTDNITFYGAASSAFPLISHQQRSLQTNRALEEWLELRKMEEHKVAWQGTIRELCELQQQLGLSLQLFPSIPRVTTGVHCPMQTAYSHAMVSLPEAYHSSVLMSEAQTIGTDMAAARLTRSRHQRGLWYWAAISRLG